MKTYEKPMMKATVLSCDQPVAAQCWSNFKNNRDENGDCMFYDVKGTGYVSFSLSADVNNCSGGGSTTFSVKIRNYYINGQKQDDLPLGNDYESQVRSFIQGTLESSNGGSNYTGDGYAETPGGADFS